MPTAFAAHRFRGPLALIATWLVVAQALLAGVALGQAGPFVPADPIDAVPICHGAGGSGADHNGAPDDANVKHLCCLYCIGAGAALAPPAAANPQILQPRTACHLRQSCGFTVLRVSRAVRAGPSHAPPRRA